LKTWSVGSWVVAALLPLNSCCLHPAREFEDAGANAELVDAGQDGGVVDTDAGRDCDGGMLLLPTATDGGWDGLRALLPSATAGVPYTFWFEGLCGSPPFTFSWVTDHGILPWGLTLKSDGDLSGTTSQPGVFTFTVAVVDGAGSMARVRCEIDVTPASSCGLGPLAIWSGGLPTMKVDEPWEIQMAAQGGCPPYDWTTGSGSGGLPPGLMLMMSGELNGVPTQLGTWSFTLTVTDTAGATASGQFELTVTQ
jgi:hypothetical protein